MCNENIQWNIDKLTRANIARFTTVPYNLAIHKVVKITISPMHCIREFSVLISVSD